MASRKSATAKKEPRPREGRRLRLLDHLGDDAFSNENLKDAAAKIARLTQIQGESIAQEHSAPSDEFTDSDTDSDTDSKPDSPIQTPTRSPVESPVDESANSPSISSDGRPDISPNVSPIYSSNESPNETPNIKASLSDTPKPLWEPVLLTENQVTLYVCLKQIRGAVTSLNLISQATKISEHTLKSCLKKLREHNLINYGGRKNSGGRFGFTAQTVERPILLRGDRGRLLDRLRRIDVRTITLTTSLTEIELSREEEERPINEIELKSDGLMDHRLDHRFNEAPLSSSNKLQLQDLQKDLILEEHFQDLNLRSLAPYLDQFETIESLQLFLDMVNASIAASQHSSKPIQNPRGFLFAQLRAGFINPPPNFKSRRVQAQEAMNIQLQAELNELRRLQEEESELRFEIFKASLSDEQQTQLEEAAEHRVKPGSGVSRERQLDVYRDEILREWFSERQ